MKLDTEDQCHLGIEGLDMDTVADGVEDASSKLDGLGDLNEVGVGELEDSVVSVWLNDDRDLDLTLELVELGSVL